jgi:hypothetical protein
MKIFSYLWAILILISPFFLSAQSIFDGNSVPLEEQTTTEYGYYECILGGYHGGGHVESTSEEGAFSACVSIVKGHIGSANECPIYNFSMEVNSSGTSATITYDQAFLYDPTGTNDFICTTGGPEHSGSIGAKLIRTNEISECPESLYTYSVETPGGSNKCANPNEIALYDTCNYNDVYSNPVSDSAACIAKSDGSICGVSAVDIGGGNSVYMPNENNCYADVYPILDENGGIGDMPDGSDEQCTESGALSYCPADPENECTDSQCNEGCGYMNGQFICVSPIEPPPCAGDDCGTEPPPCTGDDCGTEPPPCTGDDCGTEPPPCTGDDCGTGGGGSGECPAGDTTCGNGGGTQPCESGSSDCIPCEAGDTSCSLVKGEKGSYDMEAAEAELLAIKEELQNKIDTIKSESSTLIPEINGGTASFNSCFDVISFQGRKENRCLTEYADEMEIISKIMLFIFTVLSGFIVLSGVTKT